MNIQKELQNFLTIVKGFGGDKIVAKDDYFLFKKLFDQESFKQFMDRTSQAVVIFNFIENKYVYASDSIKHIYGVDKELITNENSIFNVLTILTPESAQIMVNTLTPHLFEYCQKYPENISELLFTTCLQMNSPTLGSKWILIHNTILCATPDHIPILSCAILTDVTAIKKDSIIYYSIHLNRQLLLQKSIGSMTEQIELTEREIDVVKLLCKGKTSKEISEELFISFETVKKHRSNILAKTKCSNTAELINVVSLMGII